MLSALLKLKGHFWKSSICITEPLQLSVPSKNLCDWTEFMPAGNNSNLKGLSHFLIDEDKPGIGDSSISSNAAGNCRFCSGFSAGISIFYGSGSFCSANYFCIFLLVLCISLPTSLVTRFGSHDPRVARFKIPFWKLIFPSPLLTHKLLPKSLHTLSCWGPFCNRECQNEHQEQTASIPAKECSKL